MQKDNFRSTLKQEILLRCLSWSWQPPVEHCVSLKFLLEYGNSTVVRAIGSHYMKLRQTSALSQGEWEVEVIATVLVGCLLMVSATIAIFILFRYRKNQNVGLEVN